MATFTVTNLNDAGAGSLRAAIEGANSSSDANNLITFSVAGTISLISALPVIGNSVSIDATTAPGFDDAALVPVPMVTVDFNGAAGLVFGVGAQGSSLSGMALGDASDYGVTLNGSGITLTQNYIGLAGDGTALGNQIGGILISPTAAGNVIGTNASGVEGTISNVISANLGNGITINGGSGHTVAANRIGVSPDGTVDQGNAGHGIVLTGATSNNTIGGTVYVDAANGDVNDPTGDKGTETPVFVVPPLGNQVSGNQGHGVLIDAGSERNTLNGNFIGTTADGNDDLGNGGDGVHIFAADNNALIGCTFVEQPFVYYNVLSGNGGNGLRITDSDNTVVQANFFGIGADNASLVGNDANGILVEGTSSGTTVGGVIPLGNVSGGNALNGLYVTDSASNLVSFNTFSGIFAFQGVAPNGHNGIKIDATGGGIEVRTCVLSGNLGNGIEISGNARDVLIDPNIAGLNTAGSEKLPNGGHGILITDQASNITVGGTFQSVIPQNTFSGNDGYGVVISGAASNVQVLNSAIGSSVTMLKALGNGAGGVLVTSTGSGNVIGSDTINADQSQANTISGNEGFGVTLGYNTSGQTVIGNAFGVDRFGAPVMPNAEGAINVNDTFANILVRNSGQETESVDYGLQPQAFYSQLQALFIGYFGRAGDASGVEFWSQAGVNMLLNGATVNEVMAEISAQFATSSENLPYSALVDAQLDRNNSEQVTLVTDFIEQTYQYLFSRVAETGGFDFWYEALFSGRVAIDEVVYEIASSANQNDQAVLNTKMAAGLYVDQVYRQALAQFGSSADEQAIAELAVPEPTALALQTAVRPVNSETSLLVSKLTTNGLFDLGGVGGGVELDLTGGNLQLLGSTVSGVSTATNTVAFDETYITGVRGDHGGQVVLTGNQVLADDSGNTQAILYKGPMLDTSLGTVYQLTPVFDGGGSGEGAQGTVISSTFYGPNTSVFDDTIALGEVRAVGSYVTDQADGVRNRGMIYEGRIDGQGGSWQSILVPDTLAGGAVANTILHSTMGDLVVGNYDLQGVAASGNAFVYNMRTETFTILGEANGGFGGTDQLTTAYGIWQDNPGSTNYTIVGGSEHGIGVNQAYVARFDSLTETFSDIRYYTFEGRPEAVTHFEGITAIPGGYNLITTTDKGAAFATISMSDDASIVNRFSEATWTVNNIVGAGLTTGNSVFQNVVMGIFEPIADSSAGVGSYVGTIDTSLISDTGGLYMLVGAPNFSYGLSVADSVGSVVVGSTTAGNVLGGSIANDTFVGVQTDFSDTFYTGGGADLITLSEDRTAGSVISFYASNMSAAAGLGQSLAAAGIAVPAVAGSVVSAEGVPQLGWWGQASGKLGGPASDANTNAGQGSGVSSSMTKVMNFEPGTDGAEIDQLVFSISAYSNLLRDGSPDSPVVPGDAVFSDLLIPGGSVSANANVLVFSPQYEFEDAADLAQALINPNTAILFDRLQTHDLNHYLVIYEDTHDTLRVADLSIQSTTDFSSTALIDGMSLSVSDMALLTGVSGLELFDGNVAFVA